MIRGRYALGLAVIAVALVEALAIALFMLVPEKREYWLIAGLTMPILWTAAELLKRNKDTLRLAVAYAAVIVAVAEALAIARAMGAIAADDESFALRTDPSCFRRGGPASRRTSSWPLLSVSLCNQSLATAVQSTAREDRRRRRAPRRWRQSRRRRCRCFPGSPPGARAGTLSPLSRRSRTHRPHRRRGSRAQRPRTRRRTTATPRHPSRRAIASAYGAERCLRLGAATARSTRRSESRRLPREMSLSALALHPVRWLGAMPVRRQTTTTRRYEGCQRSACR